jgi:hypothetical protein
LEEFCGLSYAGRSSRSILRAIGEYRGHSHEFQGEIKSRGIEIKNAIGREPKGNPSMKIASSGSQEP